ncbi:hypothetical protein NKH18_46290 [Streptomyces sp. M10(2022)]
MRTLSLWHRTPLLDVQTPAVVGIHAGADVLGLEHPSGPKTTSLRFSRVTTVGSNSCDGVSKSVESALGVLPSIS